jgi:hypothetical protein
MNRHTATPREQQAEAACLCRGYGRQAKLDAATCLRQAICLTCGARRQPERGRQVAANLPACRDFREGRKEFGYGG